MKQLIVFFIIAFLASCYGAEPEKTGLEGKALPAFTLLLSDSSTYLNTENIPNGKPVALFYFGPYCGYSRAQMQEIIDDMDKLKGIQFYLVTRAPFQDMKHFYNDYHLNKFDNITVGQDTAAFVANYFEITGVPYMAIYGKDKKLNKAFLGKIYSKQIVAAAGQ